MLKTWRGYVEMYLAGTAQVVEPCSSATVPPTTGIFNDSSWAGNVAHNQIYTDVESQWTVPDASGASNSLSSHWVGIGLGNSMAYPLVQAGEESPGSGNAYAWVETYYPGDPVPEQPVAGFLSIQNDVLYVHVRFGTDGSVATHLINETTGLNAYPTPQHYAGMMPDGHAEWISENPNGMAQPLADFGQVRFVGDDAAYTPAGWVALGSLPHYYVNMTKGGDLLAYPGSIDPTGLQFTNYWNMAS